MNFIDKLKRTHTEAGDLAIMHLNMKPKQMEFPLTEEEEAILSGLYHHLSLKKPFKDAVRSYIFQTVNKAK